MDDSGQLDKLCERDARFIETLCSYDSRALAQFICEIAYSDNGRVHVFETLDAVQSIGESLGMMTEPGAKILVLKEVSRLVEKQNRETGPAGLNPYSIEELCQVLNATAASAQNSAEIGDNTSALNEILNLAAKSVYGLIWHIQKNPSAVWQKKKNRKPAPAATEAGQSKSQQ